ncbi:hypothetical protein [Pseudonocardia spinosispora]|uniref:hypothetical protein n=1 Tax=Pseudonocardia spinosispora TaxID=103441 RepID=UPI0003FF6F56|nr:hypothetical protein [Pseudonocardia spinosispora]
MIGGAWLMLLLAGLALVVVGIRGAMPARDRQTAVAHDAPPARTRITVGEYVESNARRRAQGPGHPTWSGTPLSLDPMPGLRA